MFLAGGLRGQFTQYYSPNKKNMNTCNGLRFGQAFSANRGRQRKLMDNWLCSYCVSSVFPFPPRFPLWFKVDSFTVFSTL